MNLDEVKKQFVKLYGEGEFLSFHSPGRVNLIGEHTDYNGGYVFPCALTLGTYGIARKRQDNILRLASTNFAGEPIEITLDTIVYNQEHKWVNYLLGVVDEFLKLGIDLKGVDLLISGNMSSNAGLSSSASVELLMSVVLNTLFECELSMIDLVKLSQRAENQFVGVSCGIMDQFAVGMGQKNKAMLLNCMSLEYRHVPVVLDGYCLVIGNTNNPRGLANSKYNERRNQCEQAVKMLNKELDIKLLGDITPQEFEAHKHLITDETILKRAKHVIYEIQRTIEAVASLEKGNLQVFGKLMNESHDSLANLYEVTGYALDTMAYIAREQKGVLGSRMTGGGFGGCTVSLVREDCVDAFIDNVGQLYKEKTDIYADFYIANIGGGACCLDIPKNDSAGYGL